MQPFLTSKKSRAFFILSTDDAVARVNEPEVLRRYRWEDSDPESLKWPADATVVELSALDEEDIADAERVAEVMTRSTPMGRQLWDDARAAALAASRAEETAAMLEGRIADRGAFVRGWSRFKRDLSREDRDFLAAHEAWRHARALEICRRSIRRIIMDTAQQVDVRSWIESVIADPSNEGPVVEQLAAIDFSDGYPVREVGQLISAWLGRARAQHEKTWAAPIRAAEAARVQALRECLIELGKKRDEEEAAGLEPTPIPAPIEIEAVSNLYASARLIELDKVDMPGIRALAESLKIKLPQKGSQRLLRRQLAAGILRVDPYPRLTEATLRLREISEKAIWYGADHAQPMWDEIGDHAERLSKLGKGEAGSSSSRPT